MSEALETLLTVQERDLALERLQHRRDTLPERARLVEGDAQAAALAARVHLLTTQRDALARDETKFDDEARSLEAKAKEVEARMYSGEISSPRELQAMQADVEQLQRHQRDVENRELEVMEQREPLDAELVTLAQQQSTVAAELDSLHASLADAEHVIDDEMRVERDAREVLTDGLDPTLVAAYEKRRETAQGVGAARLVGTTCQGCHLSIPAIEAEQIKKAPEGSIAYCDNCGCILVP
ncbi:MAG TPA: C4-type zinc ribbon domain-containing protein [Acidimicrobiia bacterium]|nr:C4-type zinc ribbon domain-containing protein [Acidimicrobiia bacterium]